MASNTAYGPLIGHSDINGDVGNGLDAIQGPPVNNIFYVNIAYVTWAGITAGKAQSFFSFTGGGDNYANFFSPDRKGFNEPLLLAYTASFGGGFTATLSAESPPPAWALPAAAPRSMAGQVAPATAVASPIRPSSPSAVRNGRISSAPCMSSRVGARLRSRA